MATVFPGNLDNYTNPQPTDDVSVVVHSTQHANHNDSIEAIEAKLGIDSSAVTSSIDYLLKSASSSDPGHTHTAASLTGIPDGSGTTNEISYWVDSNTLGALAVATYPSLTEVSYVKGVTSAIQTQLNTKIDAIGDTITSGTSGSLLYVGAGPVLAQTGSTVYLSSDNFYFDQTGTGANQDTKGLYFKPTFSDGTVRTTFGIYAKGLGANTYPELVIGGTGATEAKIRIRSLTGAGETIYFHATDVDFSNVSGPIYLKKLYLASPGESPHATEKLFLRSTANIIGAGFEIAHYGSTPQEIVYIHNNPWTGASSGGAMYTIRLRSDTTDWNLAANWTATWATATHASRKGRATFNVYDTAIREAIRIEASGSAPMVGFYGTTAVVQAANTTDLGTVLSDVGLRASGTAYPITTSGAVSFTGTIGLGGQITISDAIDIALNTTTGTKIGTATNQKLGFYNKTPVVQPTALTTQLTSITHTAPGTPDYAIQDLVDSSGGAAFGFATKDEGNTVLSVILNLQTRVAELETKLQSLGLLA